MPKFRLTAFLFLLSALILAAPFSDAQAKRFGGGRSFGGKSFYNTPYRRSQIPKRPSYSQQKAIQKNQNTRQSWRNRGGFLGMLAPFLIGGLLGSLFFGGAFENINFADLLVFGGLAFLAFKLLSQRTRATPQTPYGYGSSGSFDREGDAFGETPQPTQDRAFSTDLLFGKGRDNSSPDIGQPNLVLPQEFDIDEFLQEVKEVFIHLQDAWNRDELAEIRGLTTDDVFIEIKDQRSRLGHDDAPTKVIELEARLIDFQDHPKTQEATVLFDALIQEGNLSPERIQEVWHFTRSKQDLAPHWLLDGIQQVG